MIDCGDGFLFVFVWDRYENGYVMNNFVCGFLLFCWVFFGKFDAKEKILQLQMFSVCWEEKKVTLKNEKFIQ